MRLMAYTPCYRREAGSAGRDTRGMLRVARVRQGRDPRLRHARAGARRARRAARPGRGADRRARPGLPGHRHLHRRPRPEPPPQLRHRGLRARAPTSGSRCSSVSLVQRLPGPPGRHPLPAGRGQGHRASCTRSTARPWPCPGCGRRSSRPTARPTARCASPRCCCRTCGGDARSVGAEPTGEGRSAIADRRTSTRPPASTSPTSSTTRSRSGGVGTTRRSRRRSPNPTR